MNPRTGFRTKIPAFKRAATASLLFSLLWAPLVSLGQEIPLPPVGETVIVVQKEGEAVLPDVRDEGDAVVEDEQALPQEESILEPEKEANLEEPEPEAMSSSMATEEGSVFVNNEATRSAAPDVDTQTGALTYEYPIDLPPGRSGMTPDLTLRYSSNAKDQVSAFGYGWGISIPYIQRINRFGVDTLYATSTESFTSSLDGELVRVGTSTSYLPRTENGAFRRYERVGDAWRIQEKSGRELTLGSTTAARRESPTTSTLIYSWHLETAQDTNGNRIEYDYYEDAGQIYPETVTYTSNGTSTGAFTVSFTRESRGDNLALYETGFRATTTYRISRIEAHVDGSWVYRYDLAYGTGTNGNRSMLTSVTRSGRDESGATKALPATNFTYGALQSAAKDWDEDAGWDVPVDVIYSKHGRDRGARFVDVNGDALPDIIRSIGTDVISTTTPTYTVQSNIWLNTGSSWATSTSWTVPQPDGRFGFILGWDPNYSRYDVDTGARFADVNHDGYTDIVWAYQTDYLSVFPPINYNHEVREVYLNNKVDGWATSTVWTLPSAFYFAVDGADNGARIADVNGDGLPDLLSPPNTYLNTGAGWALATTTWSVPEPLGDGYGDPGTRMADINGDGLTDILRYRDSDDTGTYPVINKVYLNHGTGWATTTAWSIPVPFASYYSASGAHFGMSARLADVNGDGLTDIIRSSSSSIALPDGNDVFINTGEGWSVDSAWAQLPSFKFSYTNSGAKYADTGFAEMDADGDNMLDFIQSGPSHVHPHDQVTGVYLHDGVVPDLLREIEYPEGGEIAVTYEQSARFEDGGTRLNPELPANLNTVATTTYDDGVTDPYTQTYAYGGGTNWFASSTDTTFAGFATTTFADSRGNVTKTYIHQGNGTNSTLGEYADEFAKIGKPYLVERYDGDDNLYLRELTRWESAATSSTSTFVFASREIRQAYDGDVDHRDTALERTYDAVGNVLGLVEYGEVVASTTDGTFSDTGSDLRATQYVYASSTTSTTVLPASLTLRDQASSTVKASRFYYDGLALGALSVGNMTLQEDWVASSTYVPTQRTYGTYGLLATEVNPRSATTTYVYDVKALYPATTTNALGQVTTATYDYSAGVAKTVSDGNGLVSEKVYDGLDRVTEEKGPDPQSGSTVTRVTYTYTDTRDAVAVTTNRYLAASSTVPIYTYYDGFGRKLQERVRAEEVDLYAVRDWVYGDDALLDAASLPYFAEDEDNDSATTTAALLVTHTYDPLGRIASREDAVGETTYVYDQWTETVTDANDVPKDFHRDAFENLAGVTEHNGTSTYATTYSWNADGKLTGIEDSLGNERAFTYDGLGRRLTSEDLHAVADGTYGTWSYIYDDAGNLIQTTDPKSQVVNRTYDLINRPLTEDFTGTGGTETSYGYDSCTEGVGRLCTATTTAAVTRYAYAQDGRIAVETRVIGGTTFVTTSTFDLAGNVLELTYPDSSAVRYTYNAAGQVESVEQKESGGSYAYLVNDFDYAPHGLATLQENANGTVTRSYFDAEHLYRLGRKTTTVYVDNEESLMMMGSAPEVDGPALYREMREAEAVKLDPLGKPYSATSTATTTILSQQVEPELLVASIAPQSPLLSLPEGHADLQLKAAPSRHLGFTEAGGVVRYAYRTEQKVDDVPIGERTLAVAQASGLTITGETEDRRTKYARTFATNRPGMHVMEVVSGDPQYYEDEKGEWWLAEYGMTTRAAYDEQVAEARMNRQKPPKEGLLSIIKSIFVPARAMALTGTFYPDASPESNTVDGTLYRTGSTSWSTVRNSTNANTYNDSGATSTVEDQHGPPSGSSHKAISRGIMLFDTSALPDTSVISSSSVQLYILDVRAGGSEKRLYLTSSNPGSNTALVTQDYDDLGSINYGNSDGTYTNNTYETIPLNASGTAAISKTGITKFGIRTHNDISNVNPSNSTELSIDFSAADKSGTSQDPKLVIVYNTDPSGATSLQADGVVNPEDLNDSRPELSGVFIDPDPGDYATSYEIEVSVSPSDWSNPIWDTGKQTLSSTTANGYRSVDIAYGGELLTPETDYFWRMRFWDSSDAIGSWATTTARFSIAPSEKLMDDVYVYDAVGNISAIVDIRDQNAPVAKTYAYDDLYRLTSVATTTAEVGFVDGIVSVRPGPSDGKDTHYGTYYYQSGLPDEDHMRIGGWGDEYFSYLEFDLDNVQDADDIESAHLKLYNKKLDANYNEVKVRRITSAWTESGVTNSSNPTSTDDVMGWQYVPDGWISIDITDLVKNWKDGTWQNYGVKLDGLYNGTNEEKTFNTSDHADMQYWPTLEVQGVRDSGGIPDVTLGTSTSVTHTFSYDALGNMLTNSDAGSYAYAGTGYANPHAPTSIASSSLSYDNNGNVTSYDGMSLGWDYLNRLGTTTVGTSTVTYGYDHTASRVQKQGTVTTKYPSRYYEVASSTATKRIYAGEELIASIEGSGTSTATTSYVHVDHLGSTRFTTDEAGDTVQELQYAPFGEVALDTLSGNGEGRQYIGQVYDPESELSYLNARYYEGSRGQFLSQDPVFWELGLSQDGQAALRNPQVQNSYSYAINNPMTYRDPEGRYFQLSGSIVAGGRALSAGLRFDSGGINVFFGGGVGVGMQGGFQAGWAPNQSLSRSREVAATISASAANGYGVEVGSDIATLNTATREVSGPKAYGALVTGGGISASFQEEVSQPLVTFNPITTKLLDQTSAILKSSRNPSAYLDVLKKLNVIYRDMKAANNKANQQTQVAKPGAKSSKK